MFDFHERRKIRGWLYSKTTIGILLILSVLLSFSVYERYVVERQVAAKRAEKEKDLEHIKSRAHMLERNIEHLQSERGMEEELRSRYDVAKEGEQVIIIVDSPPPAAVKTVPTSRMEVENEESSFMKTLQFWE